MATFKGFSTIGRLFPPYGLTDIELVKQDLLNEFNTRIGERVMRPTFGTVIFDLLMDPNDDMTKQAIEDDAIRIVKKDPRVELFSVDVRDFSDAIVIEIILLYTPNRLQESLFITYQKSTGLANQPRLLQSGEEANANRVR